MQLLWLNPATFLAGPIGRAFDRLPGWAVAVGFGALGLTVILTLFELFYRLMDGPFPTIPPGVRPVYVHRRKLYPWMVAAALLEVFLLVFRARIRASWVDNWEIAELIVPLGSCVIFWFLYYSARRFDYGQTVLPTNAWLHWVYMSGELENFTGLDPKAQQETWMGPGGLLYVGDFAPWNLSLYELVKAEANLAPPPKVIFTFEKTSFASKSQPGGAKQLEIMRVAIPQGRTDDLALIQTKLRALCPKVDIRLAPE